MPTFYTSPASYKILYAKITMSFVQPRVAIGNATNAVNITARVDGLRLVNCPEEPYVYDAASGVIQLSGLVGHNTTDCVAKFVTVMGGVPSQVSLIYNSTLDTLTAGFEREYCVFTRRECTSLLL